MSIILNLSLTKCFLINKFVYILVHTIEHNLQQDDENPDSSTDESDDQELQGSLYFCRG